VIERFGGPVFTPPPDTAEDLVRKFGVTREEAGDGSPDLAWLLVGDGVEAHLYAAGDRLPIGIDAFLGREHNDLLLWMERVGAVVPGDTLVDFGRGLEINEWLRGGVTANRSSNDCGRCFRYRSSSCSRHTEHRWIVPLSSVP
jgi:hypothetical protein